MNRVALFIFHFMSSVFSLFKNALGKVESELNEAVAKGKKPAEVWACCVCCRVDDTSGCTGGGKRER